VVFERTREIGTLRALGMTRTRLGLLFTSEASFLGLFGALAGSVLGLGLLSLASLVNLGSNSLAQMFLVAGHLRPEVPFEQIAWSLLALIAAAMLGALAPALHGAQMTPANALRME
jgi:ABC-type antimicrobial peptide transport system permease subunit